VQPGPGELDDPAIEVKSQGLAQEAVENTEGSN